MTLPRAVKLSLAALLFLLGLAASVVVSLVVAYQAARVVSQIAGLVVVTLLVFFLGVLLTTVLAGKVTRTLLNQNAAVTSGAWTILFAVGLYFAVFRPIHYRHYNPVPRTNTQYWELSTGSHIAYSVYEPPVGVPVKPEPIVFAHGGPGLRVFDTDHAFYSQFTQDGFRVYLFDQVGSGLSGQLAHGYDYTVERFVADLEAIRQQIGAERLILIGHSWGSTLIAHYAAAYPDHVAKLVFHSPGGIWNWTASPFEDQRTAKMKAALPPTRILAAIMLSRVNIDATEKLLPQNEFGDWAMTAQDPGELVCKGERGKLPAGFTPDTLAGTNAYPFLVTGRELHDSTMDVRSQLSRVHAPAIMLTSECDFVPWTHQSQYKKFIPGLQTYYFQGSGHFINFSQPGKLAALLRSFLLDQPPPFPSYDSDKDPRPSITP